MTVLSSQYYALQILETVIKTRWKILPRNQCEGRSELISSLDTCFFFFFLIKTRLDLTLRDMCRHKEICRRVDHQDFFGSSQHGGEVTLIGMLDLLAERDAASF